MILTREAILGTVDRKVEKVHVEAWGGDVYVRSMSGAERDRFESSNMVQDRRSNTFSIKMENLRARLVVLTVCDEAGNRVFTDADAAVLGEKNGAVISQLYDVASRLSGLTKADLEELVKNSETGPAADSSSV